MSFPYRLIELFTNDQTIQVLILRAMNIGLFAAGTALYRRLLLKTGAPKTLVHLCLLIFVLIPIVPLLAAQINYDNLFLPLTALTLILTVNFSKSLVKRDYPNTKLVVTLLIICLLTSLVKYAFLPLFVLIVGFIAVRLWLRYRSFGAAWRNLAADWKNIKIQARIGLLAVVLLSATLFTQRYGVNIVRYHSPVPDCGKVLTVEQCSEYGPWIRDYNLKLANVGGPRSLRTFDADWFYGMWLRTFFAVDGPGTHFQTRGPLVLPGVGTIVLGVIGVLAMALAVYKRLFKKYDVATMWLLAVSAAGYIIVLWIDDYQAYMRTGQPVAINGRYLLPVLLPLLLIAATAIDGLLNKKNMAKTILATLAVVSLAWGGGALTYILRSNNDWYWPSTAVRTANKEVRQIVGPVTPGYHQPVQFLH